MKGIFHELRLEADRLFGGGYPDFVTSRRPAHVRGHVPVFVYHSVDAETFRRHLEHLARNGYRTLAIDEFWAHMRNESTVPDKAVLLTFDDGRRTVRTEALPLLEEFGFQATVFVIPGYVPSTPSRDTAPPWRDEDPLLSWGELEELASSGRVQIQSHTLFHHRVFSGPEIVGFLSPATGDPIYNAPVPRGLERQLAEDPASMWGTPIFESAPPMTGERRFQVNSSFVEACQEFSATASDGDPGNARWEKSMRRFTREWMDGRGEPGRFLSADETRDELESDLDRSRKLIEEHLGNEGVKSVCFPYGLGSSEAVQAAAKVGYAGAFWVWCGDRTINAPGMSPFHCVRLKADYLPRLPGAGRQSLSGILGMKLTRRVRGERVY